MGDFADPSFMDVIFNTYPVSFIMLVNSSFGFGMAIAIYTPQIKHMMKIINTLLCQIAEINHKRD